MNINTWYSKNIPDFNSIKVRLKRRSGAMAYSYQKDFNSIKVRLKLATTSARTADRQFQFHKGTIKTVQMLCSFRPRQPFQFHKGTIKTR